MENLQKNESLPLWDLSAYYNGIDDPKIDADILEATNKSLEFEKRFRGQFITNAETGSVLLALKEFEEITLQAHKPIVFAQNVQAVDSNNPANGALLQKTMKAVMDIGSLLTFFTLELNNLPTEKLKDLSEASQLSNYKHFFEKLIEIKSHRLSEKEEIILQQKSLTSGHAFVRLFDEHQSSKKFNISLDGKIQQMNQSDILDLMKDANRERRRTASKAFSNALQEDLRLYTYILNTLIEDKNITDKLTKFKTPEQSRHLDNDIPQSVVDTMVSVVSENFNIVENYYNNKKQWLGVEVLYEYDRYAPIFESEGRYTFEEAKKIVLESFNNFSAEFGRIAQLFFDNKWIHAPTISGKRGGAYCSGGTPDKHPLVLVNYKGRLDDVNTLAHELGHGVNDYLMRDLNLLNFDTTLVMAETASVFAEMLVFDYLKEQIKDPKEKFALHVLKVESMFATVFRQVSMHKFEQVLHQARIDKGELSGDVINQQWMETQTLMFGNSIKFSEGYKYWWSYIQHFYHSPFYVYSYAFGELLVLSLYAKYKQEGQTFVPKYLELMSSGVAASPQDLLKPLGIDLNDRQFWQQGVDMISELVEETNKLRV
ncbi:MAG: M3 family oligoendopeptidase [Candidatus Doudnabacteria bacterium]|nr:M3 family oligoendopeptidase [Candidatus Doudnabacteria bacterium]